MSELKDATLCVLGCGNLGRAILENLLPRETGSQQPNIPFAHFIACVRSEKSQKALEDRFSGAPSALRVRRGQNVAAVQESDVVILAADPADVSSVLAEPGLRDALGPSKLLISVVAGWTRQKLEAALYGDDHNDNANDNTANAANDNAATAPHPRENRAWILRTLPNIAALVSQSLTAIEIPDSSSSPQLPERHLSLAEAIFARVGRTVRIPPRLMNAATAVGGSTPAFFAVICDALIDASVAVGVPREVAGAMVFQAMRGTAAMLQGGGVHPALLKDQGTSPEGCTIGGLMVLEEGAVRGHVGRALREAVTVARLMERVEHVNDTRH